MSSGDPFAPPDRREMLRLAAASLALAAAAGCDGEGGTGQKLHAGAAEPARMTATVLDLEGLGRGVLVRSRNGQAVKVEGNPDHPASLGATDPFMQAAVLSLHDPERSRRIRQAGRPVAPDSLASAMQEARETLTARSGEGLALLTGPVSSPTLARMIGEVLARFPGARWHQWNPLADDAAVEGAQRAFGRPIAVLPDLARARAVLSLGRGPLEHGPAQLRWARDWAAARAEGRASGRMPVLIAAEATPGLTGARSDRLLSLPPTEIATLARAVAVELGVELEAPAAHPGAPPIAAALRRAGAALVLAGRDMPAEVHALAHAMNATLGAALRHVVAPLTRPESMGASLAALREAMAAGQVTHLLMLDANPAHAAPDATGFRELLQRLPFSLHAGLYADETALASLWHVPLRHPLEAWGDSRAFDGTLSLRQPATVPLVPLARTAEEILSALLGEERDGQALVRATWESLDEEGWRAALEAGVVSGSAAPEVEVALRPGWDAGPSAAADGGLVAHFAPDAGAWDGAFADNAWLQELPRPLTKLAWGGAALVAPDTARELGLADGEEVELSLSGRSLRAPVLALPGQARGVVTLPLGLGRPSARGNFDAYALRPANSPWSTPGLALRRTGAEARTIRAAWRHPADTEDASPRSIAPGDAFPRLPPTSSLYQPWEYPGQAWGMAIDLDACIGCNACILACQAENNIPVVGSAEVERGREMHWLRVETHAAPDGTATFQPIPCMHCEKAPCEVVCPVNATVHDSEGLNAMVHARCIGTRTCSNNCPYKVRRFNWFDYARAPGGLVVRNPDVSARPRGVMEKCTYCSHRIAAARSDAHAAGRDHVAEGEVTTACAQACPTHAIAFGDLNDPDSAVARARREGRHYALLGHLDTRPRTTYLARIQPAERGA
jgi:molybdopterin-containing oxidoreductase family iron-sulfur binding subunit